VKKYIEAELRNEAEIKPTANNNRQSVEVCPATGIEAVSLWQVKLYKTQGHTATAGSS
jgi:hypothetical protein